MLFIVSYVFLLLQPRLEPLSALDCTAIASAMAPATGDFVFQSPD
jgi:hypothetical protein